MCKLCVAEYKDKTDARQVVADLLRVVEMLMPGVGAIAVADYQLLNEAPIRARRWLAGKEGP